MAYILLRSIPLSADTLAAWRSQEVLTIPGHPDLNEVEQWVRYREDVQCIHGMINLGVSQFDPVETDEERGYAFWWNRGAAIRMTRRPSDLRIHMGDLLPPMPSAFPADAWVKGPGHKGQGKSRHLLSGLPVFMPRGADIQLHVEGQEYRVLTVNHRVVQSFERSGDNSAREYSWRGVTNTPRIVKQAAREASKRIPGYNMYAWDIILGTTQEDPEPKAYVLEGNSSPGVNSHSTKRILDMMLRVWMDTRAGREEPTEDAAIEEETTEEGSQDHTPRMTLIFGDQASDIPISTFIAHDHEETT
jgi:hypothetical protein